MRPPEGSRLDDALDMWHNDSWDCPGGKVNASTEQIAHVLKVLRGWYHDEFFPRRLPAVSKERERKQSNARVDRGSQKLGRDRVYGRSGGWCEIALAGVCTGLGQEWHHRLNKGQGGRWDASNGLHACSACHLYVTSTEREQAKRNGWAVAPGATPPIEVPVLRRGVLVYLDDEGFFEPVQSEVA